MAGVLEWELQSSTDTTIRLFTGHLQVRASSYIEEKTSLKWQDLIENPKSIAAKIATSPPYR